MSDGDTREETRRENNEYVGDIDRLIIKEKAVVEANHVLANRLEDMARALRGEADEIERRIGMRERHVARILGRTVVG